MVVSSRDAATLTVYGTAHLLVDACCAAAAFRIASIGDVRPETFVALLLLYHVLAFGLQVFFGLAVDALRRPRAAAVVGCLSTIAALAMPSLPVTALVIAGIGNAVFHVGGGAISLQLAPHRAAMPGVFVAPGSIGVLLGCVLGRLYPAALMPLGLVAAAACVAMTVWPVVLGKSRLGGDCARTRHAVPPGQIVLGLILLAIAVRALLGFVVTFPWDSRPGMVVSLTAATCLGQALGGFAADRWGWRRVGVGAILFSLPLLAASSAVPKAAIPGLFLLNLTMPVTLVAVAERLPGHAGFAFGLPCLALLLGAMPSLLGIPVGGTRLLVAVLLIATASLYRGLGRPKSGLFFNKETHFADRREVGQVET